MRIVRKVAAIGLLLATGCSAPDPVWIVVELERPDGRKATMAFNNPAVPDITLAECRESLDAAIPTLLEGIEARDETRGSRLVSATCVASPDDPIRPQ